MRIPFISDTWAQLGQALQNDLEGMKHQARQLDVFSRQSGSLAGKLALKVSGLAYAAATLPQRVIAPLAYGVVDFPAALISDPIATAKSIPESVEHNGYAMLSGGADVYDGNVSAGLMSVTDGFFGDLVLCAPLAKGMTMAGLFKKASPVAETPLARQLAAATQARAEVAFQKVMQPVRAAEQAAFNSWMRNTRPGFSRGAIEVPQWMLPVLGKPEYLKLFRQSDVTNADLAALTQHTNATVSAAAKQVLAERTTPIPEGYVQIPHGKFKGQILPPFAMKATPVTNGEWLQGIAGKPRFVQLVEDPVTKVIRVEDVMANPPSCVDHWINFDAGVVAVAGSKILMKLVDNPSAVYDASGQVFSRPNQPVVGVNYYQAQAWVLTDASGRLMLPTDLMQEAVASKYGAQEYGTVNGRLYGADGRKLGHFDEWNNGKGTTTDVNDPRYPAGPYGVHSTGNVWRWMQAEPQKSYPHALRGASWSSSIPENLRAAFRYDNYPLFRFNNVGFQPVVLLAPPK